jgi:hypothetical protein
MKPRKTLMIAADLHRALKLAALNRDTKLEQLADTLLRRGLKASRKPTRRR